VDDLELRYDAYAVWFTMCDYRVLKICCILLMLALIEANGKIVSIN